jgi:serine/threonine protein kinase
MHRDIKPDNLLLDSDGNCHLTDFNLSAKLIPGGNKGVAGTRPYMAPEILSRSRYDERADWWSLGVLCYELYCGRLPYHGSNYDELRKNIKSKTPPYPRNCDSALKSLIRGLLTKDPKKRLNFEQIKAHECFEGLDWYALENKIAQTPWQPDPVRHENKLVFCHFCFKTLFPVLLLTDSLQCRNAPTWMGVTI